MPEIRMNPVSIQGVIIAGERSKRPFNSQASEASPFHCPFCFGHESDTPQTLDETIYPNQPNRWAIRSIQNRYAALAPIDDPWYVTDFALNLSDASFNQNVNPESFPNEANRPSSCIQWKREDGNGWHEVIIESPDHVVNCGILNEEHWRRLILFYARRMERVYSDSRWQYVQLFKNQGAQAGASMAHIHSQLLAMPFIPPIVLSEYRRLTSLQTKESPCVWCAVISAELKMQARIVAVTDSFVVLCPFAARFAGETWVLPRDHISRFDKTPTDQLRELGTLMAKLVARVEATLPIPSYNIVYRTAPRLNGTFPDAFHWRLEIVPRLNGIAGFELGTGLFINTIVPEEFAKSLRWDDSFARSR